MGVPGLVFWVVETQGVVFEGRDGLESLDDAGLVLDVGQSEVVVSGPADWWSCSWVSVVISGWAGSGDSDWHRVDE